MVCGCKVNRSSKEKRDGVNNAGGTAARIEKKKLHCLGKDQASIQKGGKRGKN